jgi:TP901 family phage tail tape measure protein
MALNNLGLGFVFTAKDFASATMVRLKREMGGLGKGSEVATARIKTGLAVATAGLVPFSVGMAGVIGSIHLAKAASEFEEGIARVGNISGASAEELQKLRKAALDVGMSSKFSPEQATLGLSELAAQGFTATESINLLTDALNLAAGGQISIQEATKATAAAVRVFNIQGEDQRQIADKLLAISNMTGLQADDLALALGTVGRGAITANQGLDEMLITMGLVRNAGLDASVAASSVSSALLFSAANSKALSKELGVSVTDSSGKFRNLLDIMKDVDAAMGDKYPDAAERATVVTDIFGRFGLTAFATVTQQLHAMVGKDGIGSVADAIDSLRKKMDDAAGTASKFSAAMLDTLKGQMDVLASSGDSLAIILGESFGQVFKPFVHAIATMVQEFARLAEKMPSWAKKGAAAFIVLTAVLLAVGGAITVVIGLVMAATPLMAAFGAASSAVMGVLLPLVAGIAAFVAIVAVGVALVRNNVGGLGDSFDRFAKRVKLGWDAVSQLFTTGRLSGSILGELNKVENSGLKTFVKNLYWAWNRIKIFFSGISEGFGAAMTLLGPSISQLSGAFLELGKAFGFIGAEGTKTFNMFDAETFQTIGMVIGGVAAGIIAVIAKVVQVVVMAITMLAKWWGVLASGVSWVVTQIEIVFAKIGDKFMLIVDLVTMSINAMIAAAARAVALVPAPFRTQGMDSFIEQGKTAEGVALAAQGRYEARKARPAAESTVLDIQARGDDTRARDQQLVEAHSFLKQMQGAQDQRVTKVQVTLDGQVLGEAMTSQRTKDQQRGFVPIMSGVG